MRIPWAGSLADHHDRAPWLDGWRDRTEQIAWTLAYERDLDADFLALYGIDLEEDNLSGPRYFALAHRLPAYSGVMAARVESEREDTEQRPAAHAAPARRAAADEPREVPMAAFMAEFPGMVSMTTAQPQEA